MRSLFPPRPFLGPFIRRVVLVWTFLRTTSVIGAVAVLRLWPTTPEIAAPEHGLPMGSDAVAVMVVGTTVFLVLVDMARRSELLFLQNLTRSTSRLAFGAVIVAVTLEALVRTSLG